MLEVQDTKVVKNKWFCKLLAFINLITKSDKFLIDKDPNYCHFRAVVNITFSRPYFLDKYLWYKQYYNEAWQCKKWYRYKFQTFHVVAGREAVLLSPITQLIRDPVKTTCRFICGLPLSLFCKCGWIYIYGKWKPIYLYIVKLWIHIKRNTMNIYIF